MSRLSPNRQKGIFDLYGSQLSKLTSSAYPQAIDLVNKLQEGDPTFKGQYLLWLVRQFIGGKIRIDEDLPQVKEDLRLFEQYKNKLPSKDINSYDLYSLRKSLDDLLQAPIEENIKGQITYDGPLGTLIYPQTQEEAKACGKGTRWCTAADKDNKFDTYHESGPIIIWIEKGGKYKGKYQFHFETGQLRDSSDKPITYDTFEHFMQNPMLRRIIQDGEKRLYEKGTMDDILGYKNSYDKTRDPVIEQRILQEDSIQGPIEAAIYAKDIMGKRWPEAELLIMQDPQAAVQYSLGVMHEEWPEAESIIMSDPYSAFDYIAAFGPKEGMNLESLVDKNWGLIINYSLDILKSRWKKGEINYIINAGDINLDMYIELMQGLPKLQYSDDEKKYIWNRLPQYSKNPRTLYKITNIFGNPRWLEAEPILRTDPMIWNQYQQLL